MFIFLSVCYYFNNSLRLTFNIIFYLFKLVLLLMTYMYIIKVVLVSKTLFFRKLTSYLREIIITFTVNKIGEGEVRLHGNTSFVVL